MFWINIYVFPLSKQTVILWKWLSWTSGESKHYIIVMVSKEDGMWWSFWHKNEAPPPKKPPYCAGGLCFPGEIRGASLSRCIDPGKISLGKVVLGDGPHNGSSSRFIWTETTTELNQDYQNLTLEPTWGFTHGHLWFDHSAQTSQSFPSCGLTEGTVSCHVGSDPTWRPCCTHP